MCVGCVDCVTLSRHGGPCAAICDGFSGPDSKRHVIKNGRFTEHYRWCSGWTMDKIKEKEKQEMANQKK